jgi:TPR repeat protein
VPTDLEQALTWYRKAAAAGNEKAGEGLLRLGGT